MSFLALVAETYLIWSSKVLAELGNTYGRPAGPQSRAVRRARKYGLETRLVLGHKVFRSEAHYV